MFSTRGLWLTTPARCLLFLLVHGLSFLVLLINVGSWLFFLGLAHAGSWQSLVFEQASLRTICKGDMNTVCPP